MGISKIMTLIETALSEIENLSWQMIVPLSPANLQILLTLLSDYISIYVFVKLLMLSNYTFTGLF